MVSPFVLDWVPAFAPSASAEATADRAGASAGRSVANSSGGDTLPSAFGSTSLGSFGVALDRSGVSTSSAACSSTGSLSSLTSSSESSESFSISTSTNPRFTYNSFPPSAFPMNTSGSLSPLTSKTVTVRESFFPSLSNPALNLGPIFVKDASPSFRCRMFFPSFTVRTSRSPSSSISINPKS